MSQKSAPITVDTVGLKPQGSRLSLWENRAAAYSQYDRGGVPRCTVAVTAYNRLEKTKYCLECIIKYTKNVDYELMLIDNGSTDGTLEYFMSLEHPGKTVIHITKNIGFGCAWLAAKRHFNGKYLVIVANDVYVTENWLKNLLTCYESDPTVGFVAPVSSNVSNAQQVDLQYGDYGEMHRKAAAHNVSDPLKWEERLRCISLIGVYSRPILDSIGLNDAAFLHDFTEDDFAFRLRRGGYRLLLCKDTWVCHDHSYNNFTPEELAAFHESANYGRAVFRYKYKGLDAWDDTLNFEQGLLATLDSHPFGDNPLRFLVAEPLCGSPVLEARNHMRRRGLVKVEAHAFTTQAKYLADLQTVAESAVCDSIEHIGEAFPEKHFDVVIMCHPVNLFPDSTRLMESLNRLTKPDGLLLYKLRSEDNAYDTFYYSIREGN